MTVEARKFTVGDYHKMADAGLFAEDERVELIEGTVYAMTPIGKRHAAILGQLNTLLAGSLAGRAVVWMQNPLPLPPHGEPEPDLLLLKAAPDFYASQPPSPTDVLLLVEVSDSSLGFDRTVKLPMYASAGIEECWTVNPIDNQTELYREPRGRRYESRQVLPFGQALTPLHFPEVEITL